MIANLKHAARNGETVAIGGGVFTPPELLDAARQLEVSADLLDALVDADKLLTQLMPGVAHIALQDYAFLNDTLMKVTATITKAKTEV